MKQNLENSIKNSLENFELPYDASAWTAMSKKLDVVQPTSTPPKSNLGSWTIAAGAVIVLSVGAYFLITQDNSVAKENTQVSQNQLDEKKSTSSKENAAKQLNENSTSTISTDSKETETNNGTATAKTNNGSKGETTNTSNVGSTQPIVNPIVNPNSKDDGIYRVSSNPPYIQLITPKVQDVCQGESITIKNENDENIAIISPSNKKFTIKNNSNLKLDANEAGTYEVIVGGQRSTFNVNAKPKLDFTIDEQTQFENGIPSTPIQTFSEGSNFIWTFDDATVKQKGKTIDAHFFTKGTKTITLTAESEKGCTAKVSKSIDISSDYKLFAPTGFEPNHSDVRRAKFIPNALLVRDVQFTMIIVDPKTGVTVFTTDNATNGWDGIDKNTGELVPAGSTYVWKVFLKNPLSGEKSEYSSTVVRR